MSATVTTTIVSIVDLKTGDILAHHDVEVDFPDDMPEAMARAVARSAGQALLDGDGS